MLRSPRPVLVSLLLTPLMGCWQSFDELPELDFSEVPYENENLAADDAVISVFDIDLKCPDGEDSRFAAVYRKGLTGPAPVAIVLHSGAFDYVEADGDPYRLPDRLTRGWAVSKVWETLGVGLEPVEPAERNDGALAAALADAGFVQIYPGNCWGDLWHNEQGVQDNDVEADAFDRNGRTMAAWMARLIVESSFAGDKGFQIPVETDASRIYLVGLGDGGRGVAELLLRADTAPVAGILVDSSPDDLTAYTAEPQVYAEEIEGFSRIFGEENLGDLDRWSLQEAAAQGLLPGRVGFLWSSADPRIPAESAAGTAATLAGVEGAWVSNRGAAEHVFLGFDLALAQDAATFLLDGTVPTE